MSKYVDEVIICEVGPRDGLQAEKTIVSTEDKVELINAIVEAGVPVVEVGSFMHPVKMPQMANTDEVFKRIVQKEGVEYRALIPNARGVERAAACGCKKVKLNVSASRAHNLANLNRTPEESVAGFKAAVDAAKDAGTAFVFMGHGTAHVAKVTYSQMSTQMQTLGYENVFIGTVEGEPEETSCEAVIEAVKAAGYTNVVLRPLMVVAGDHANNDMAGSEDDSWKTMFEAAGFTVDCQIAGLGEIADVQALYVAHTKAAIDALNA